MRLTDWRGNEYTVGDTILYPRQSGRSVEMCEAVVDDIRRVWYDGHSYRWRKVDDTTPPHEDPEKFATRVTVIPTGRGARQFHRMDGKIVWLDENGQPCTWEKAVEDPDREYIHPEYDRTAGRWVDVKRRPKKSRREAVDIKPVTIINIENITVPRERSQP